MAKEKTLEIEEIKAINLDTLLYFREVCEKYGLRYYLAFGTLLGAARHAGYIPWDDDVDVLIPRSDYEKLLSLRKEIETDEHVILSYLDEPDFILPYAKMCNKKTVLDPPRFCSGFKYGLSIDLFPLDVLPCSDLEEARAFVSDMHRSVLRVEQKAYKRNVTTLGGASTVKRLVKNMMYRLKNQRDHVLKTYYETEEKLRNFEHVDSDKCFYFYNRYETVWEKKDFWDENKGGASTLLFEGEPFNAPADWNAVLTKIYGDYMKLPPEEKRVPIHSYRAYRI